MALDEMLAALEQEGEENIEKLIAQAEASKNQIIKNADEEAARIRENSKREIEDRVRMEKSKIIGKANFYVKKEVIKAKETIMNSVFDEIAKRISNLRENRSYEGIFERLAAESLANIKGKPVISVDKADKELARKVFDRMELNYELNSNIKCIGGLKMESEDGRIILNNTIDSRMAKAKQMLKTDVLKVLFGEG